MAVLFHLESSKSDTKWQSYACHFECFFTSKHTATIDLRSKPSKSDNKWLRYEYSKITGLQAPVTSFPVKSWRHWHHGGRFALDNVEIGPEMQSYEFLTIFTTKGTSDVFPVKKCRRRQQNGQFALKIDQIGSELTELRFSKFSQSKATVTSFPDMFLNERKFPGQFALLYVQIGWELTKLWIFYVKNQTDQWRDCIWCNRILPTHSLFTNRDLTLTSLLLWLCPIHNTADSASRLLILVLILWLCPIHR